MKNNILIIKKSKKIANTIAARGIINWRFKREAIQKWIDERGKK